MGNGEILAGDELLYIGDVGVEGGSTAEILDTLGTIPPGSVLTMQVQRDGAAVNIEQTCGNIADYQRVYLEALDFASRKKWYDCIDALAGRPEDIKYLDLRARCAQVSRKADDYPIQKWRDTAMRQAIMAGVHAGDNRKQIALSLLKSRIELTPSVYDSLVSQVVAWDNGAIWDGIQPDIAMLRRAAERGVKGRLIDPQSAIIEMPYDFIYGTWSPAFSGSRAEGFMTCGTVNAKNRMGGYTGSTYFISVVDESGLVEYTDMDSSTSEYYRPVDNACSQLIKKLNYIGSGEALEDEADTAQDAQPTIAEQLATLAKLHESGALSDEEYASAKARVLSPD